MSNPSQRLNDSCVQKSAAFTSSGKPGQDAESQAWKDRAGSKDGLQKKVSDSSVRHKVRETVKERDKAGSHSEPGQVRSGEVVRTIQRTAQAEAQSGSRFHFQKDKCSHNYLSASLACGFWGAEDGAQGRLGQ